MVSTTPTPVVVTVPLLVTPKVYVMVAPTLDTAVGAAALVTVRARI
jgi:hypothetical protein